MRDNLTIKEKYLERLQPHSVLPEPITYGCAYCDFETGSMSNLLQHIREVNGHFVQESCRLRSRLTTHGSRAFDRRARRRHRRRQGACECRRQLVDLLGEPEPAEFHQQPGGSDLRRLCPNSPNGPQTASISNNNSTSNSNSSSGGANATKHGDSNSKKSDQ